MSLFPSGTSSSATGGSTTQSDPAKEAAKMRFDDSKKAYKDALDKAKNAKRSFMPITTDPGFAQNTDDLYLPQIINAPEDK